MQPATIQLKLTLEHKDEAHKFEKELQAIHQKLQLNITPKKCRVDSKFRGAHSYNYFGYIDQFIEKVAPLLNNITHVKTHIDNKRHKKTPEIWIDHLANTHIVL